MKAQQLQHRDETSPSANAKNVALYGNQQPRPEEGKVHRLFRKEVELSSSKCPAPEKGDDIVRSAGKLVAVSAHYRDGLSLANLSEH